MKILGVDAALRRTGYAVIAGDRARATLLARGIIDTRVQAHEAALCHIETVVGQLVDSHQPDYVYFEQPGEMNKHQGRAIGTVVALAEAGAAIQMAAAKLSVPVRGITQSAVKQALCGDRSAPKTQVQNMLALLAQTKQLLGYEQATRAGLEKVYVAGKRKHKPVLKVDADMEDGVAVAWAGLQHALSV